MKIVGKLLLTTVLAMGVVHGSETIFNLSKQDFATQEGGKKLYFKLNDDVMVQTNLVKDKEYGAYVASSKGQEGAWKFIFTKPLKKWTMIVEYDVNYKDNIITFKDDEFNTFTFRTTRHNRLYFQDLVINTSEINWNKQMEKNIVKFIGDQNTVKLYINNKFITKQSLEGFTGVDTIEMNLESSSRAVMRDYLYNLIIKKN